MTTATAPAPTTAPPRPAPPRRRRNAGPWAVGAGVFAVYAAVALRLHARFETTGYDLGIFGQAVRHYADGQWPASELRSEGAPGLTAFPLLGDHFHPVLALLGPLYALVPRVELLLVVQAALVALSAGVVTGCAARRGLWGAPALGVAYAGTWGLQSLIGFDFHEVAFAVPLLALSLAAWLDGRWTACAWWGAALLLVKEDMGLTVAAIGVLLIRRHLRAGLLLCVGGPLAMALVLLVVLPAFSPSGGYGYLDSASGTFGLFQGLDTKANTVLMLLLPTGLLAVRSPLLLVALPTLAWRFASGNTVYWGTSHHYSAVLMPVVFLALVDTLSRLRAHRRTATVLPAALLAVAALATATTAPFGPLLLARAGTPSFWTASPRTAAGGAALALVPDGAVVAASNSMAPHLTDRATVYLLTPGAFAAGRPVPEWLVADDASVWPGPTAAALGAAAGYERLYSAEGFSVWKRVP
ncbi:DUF2079 domain-containing protein [Kitasatospora albolonga]|uniref:DUF2079 domain-containing protein n=1 Tax=Kitasatospora albolonga TaxID=68173 RepID=UPI0035EE4908